MPPVALDRSPAFWAAYALLAAVALAFAIKLFPLAIPLVNLDIKLSRGEALARAQALAAKLVLAPPDARSAVRFSSDEATQNYVELEGGGKPAFGALVRGNLFSPYTWDVRLFKAGEAAEALLRFTPDGVPVGFVRRVPETYIRDPATRTLDAKAAQALAETRARDDWGVDLTVWKLLEQSQQATPSGRGDHGFVYERAERLADARIRLRLAVSGDELTELTQFVHVPEAFERRYEELRSANNAIARTASLVAGLAYGVGGCLVGVLWLARRRLLLWRPALGAGLVVSGLLALTVLAGAPAAWFGFDTAQSEQTFWVRQAGGALALFLGGGVGLGLVFMAAESLSRLAFPHQPQLWRLWSREAAPTVEVLGRTVGGYLFVPLALALIAAFYYATNRWLGWWQPSSALTDPNVLASAVPALAPIALSLQAGFMEECLFRAVPLALGALVGARFGARNAGIAIAVVLQAAVFAGAHANYPGLPSYSRLVELFVPSLIWAAIFLRYGLLPTILLHAVFDLALFSIPIFLSDAPGIDLQRALIIAAGAAPLLVVLFRRWLEGRWSELPDALRNGAWIAPAASTGGADAPPALTLAPLAARFQRALPLLALVGAIAWFATADFRTDVPGASPSRAQVEAAADAALAARGVSLAPPWVRQSSARHADDDATQWTWHKFVWREAGPEAYRGLVGSTLAPPLWEVRYARFEGDVAERAEEWRVTVNPDGSVRQLRHVLPEGRAGATLGRAAALALAEGALRERLGADPAALQRVAAQEQRRPARSDWSFQFTDPRVAVGAGGEARLQVAIAGDEVTGAGRFVFVPEGWGRAERDRESRYLIVRMALALALAAAGLAALVLGVTSWTRGHSDWRATAGVAAIVLAAWLAKTANGWPQMAMALNTAEPVPTQVLMRFGTAALAGVLAALLIGLAAGVGFHAAQRVPRVPLAGRLPPWAAGAAAALFAAGLATGLASLAPRTSPLWPSWGIEATAIPAAGAVLAGFAYVGILAVGLFLLHVLERVTAGWTKRLWVIAAILALVHLLPIVEARDPGVALASGLVAGLAAAAVLLLLFRYDARSVPAYFAVGLLAEAAVRAAQKGTPTAWWYYALFALTVLGLAWASHRWIANSGAANDDGAGEAPAPSAAATT